MEITILQNGLVKQAGVSSLAELCASSELAVATIILPFQNPLPFEKIPQGFRCKRISLEIEGRACYILHQGLDFYPKPRQSVSKTSKAVYLAEKRNSDSSLLLQYLPPHSATSLHLHKSTTEVFHNLVGSCVLDVNYSAVRLSLGSLSLAPEIAHRMRTQNLPALNLIEMQGNPFGLSTNDHIYVF